MEWYEELDFDENPFSTNPKKFAAQLSGMETILEDVFYRVAAGSMLFIEGKKGSGKSSILWNVIKKYRGRGKIIYVDCSQLEKELNIEKLLVNKHGFIRGRIMKRKPKNMILLLDNIDELSPRNSERVKYFFDQGYIHSVVFAGENYKKIKFSKSLKERIGGRIINTPVLEPYQAVSLVRNRIGDSDMISDEFIEDVFKSSGKDPFKFLQNLDSIFSFAVENNEEKITKQTIKKVIGG